MILRRYKLTGGIKWLLTRASLSSAGFEKDNRNAVNAIELLSRGFCVLIGV